MSRGARGPRRRGRNRPRYGLHRKVVERFGVKGDAVYILIATALAAFVSGGTAYLLGMAFLFPAIGPTVFMLFEAPLEPESSPRNTLIGHGTALIVGALALWALGAFHAPDVLQTGVTATRLAAAVLSLGITQGLLVALRAPHPPAGATTLVVALGFFKGLAGLWQLGLAVLLISVSCFAINRLIGIPVPIWTAE